MSLLTESIIVSLSSSGYAAGCRDASYDLARALSDIDAAYVEAVTRAANDRTAARAAAALTFSVTMDRLNDSARTPNHLEGKTE